MQNNYDIIVIGAGHAGCEAASASARMGLQTLLLTMDMTKFAQMSCNPSIGGIAKGQIVREIDALGGFTGIVADLSTLQFRMLNSSKGPAMWSPRSQCDRMKFSSIWRNVLEKHCKLDIWQDSAISLSTNGSFVTGIHTSMGAEFKAKRVILTAGTFLNGKIFIGNETLSGGRIGEPSSFSLSDQICSFGLPKSRMKTGTPPRIDVRSVDLSKLIVQTGDECPGKFSFLDYLSPIQSDHNQKPCFIAHTNPSVHEILRNDFKSSPLFSGKISGKGPRYCPSIEDKLRTFSDKDSHQLFLEPEGWSTNEYYLQGFSSSLPLVTQLSALERVEGFEHVKVYRPAYAIEYDYFDPIYLRHTLESKVIGNLYLAGQVNGTTGYEEAAAQGLMAGINASLSILGREPLILSRDQAYIGVLIDDLVTKGVDEPYRMFTSRAEHRILLRQDNADERLTSISYNMGLADRRRMDLVNSKYTSRDTLISTFNNIKFKPENINSFLSSISSSQISSTKSLSYFITRPELSLDSLIPIVPCGTFDQLSLPITINNTTSTPFQSDFFRPFEVSGSIIESTSDEAFKSEILSSTEIAIKYKGYIDKENLISEKIKRLSYVSIPTDFDFSKLTSISIESRQKLTLHRPSNIFEASSIPGVSPADISVLLVCFGR